MEMTNSPILMMLKLNNPFFYVNGYTNIWLVSNAKEKRENIWISC